jgi:hypothetical protein
LHGYCLHEAEDLTQRLYEFLRTMPPKGVKHCHCKDRIEIFDPNVTGDSKMTMRDRFDVYVKFIMRNFVRSLRKREQKNPVNRSVSLDIESKDEAQTMSADESIYQKANDEYRRRCALHLEIEAYVMLNEVAHFVEKRDPLLVYVLWALKEFPKMVDAREACGLSVPEFTRARDRLKTLMLGYNDPKKQRIPKWKRFARVKPDLLNASCA